MEKALRMGVGEEGGGLLWAREGERREPGGGHRGKAGEVGVVLDPEVLERPLRRKYTAEYKLRVLEEADRCMRPGELGALLRREGLYSSNLTTWRRQRERGVLEALSPKKRGRKAKVEDPRDRRIRELERENQRLEKRLKQAESIIEFQKKLSEILGIPLEGEQGAR